MTFFLKDRDVIDVIPSTECVPTSFQGAQDCTCLGRWPGHWLQRSFLWTALGMFETTLKKKLSLLMTGWWLSLPLLKNMSESQLG